jgi:hypothetical protein
MWKIGYQSRYLRFPKCIYIILPKFVILIITLLRRIDVKLILKYLELEIL